MGPGWRGAVDDLARAVVDLAESGTANFRFLYPDDMPLLEKVRTIAQRIYGASDIEAGQPVRDQFKQLEDQGFGHFPVCIAKTQFSFTTDPNAKGAPSDHTLTVRELRLSAGAGIRGRDLRRYHDSAGPAAGAGRKQYRG